MLGVALAALLTYRSYGSVSGAPRRLSAGCLPAALGCCRSVPALLLQGGCQARLTSPAPAALPPAAESQRNRRRQKALAELAALEKEK